MRNKGFTLIELLVVISIIALLATIVLASVISARSRAGDDSAKAGMKQLGAQLEIAAGSSGFGLSYSNTSTNCGNSGVFANSQVQQILINILSNAQTAATFTCNTDSTGNKWAVSLSALKSGAGSWCIDNSSHIETGTAGSGSSGLGSCP